MEKVTIIPETFDIRHSQHWDVVKGIRESIPEGAVVALNVPAIPHLSGGLAANIGGHTIDVLASLMGDRSKKVDISLARSIVADLDANRAASPFTPLLDLVHECVAKRIEIIPILNPLRQKYDFQYPDNRRQWYNELGINFGGQIEATLKRIGGKRIYAVLPNLYVAGANRYLLSRKIRPVLLSRIFSKADAAVLVQQIRLLDNAQKAFERLQIERKKPLTGRMVLTPLAQMSLEMIETGQMKGIDAEGINRLKNTKMDSQKRKVHELEFQVHSEVISAEGGDFRIGRARSDKSGNPIGTDRYISNEDIVRRIKELGAKAKEGLQSGRKLTKHRKIKLIPKPRNPIL